MPPPTALTGRPRLTVGADPRAQRAQLRRALLVALLGWALLVAAQLGQTHRYAHPAPATAGVASAGPLAAAHHHAEHAADPAPHATWLERLFGTHLQLDCQLLDQLVHGSAPAPALAPWLPEPAPMALVPLRRTLALADRAHPAYHARAPPSLA